MIKNTPRIIKNIIKKDNLTCSACGGTQFNNDDLILIGVQSSVYEPHNEVLAIGFLCKKCDEMTIFEVKEMSMKQLSNMVLNRIGIKENKKSVIKNRRKK